MTETRKRGAEMPILGFGVLTYTLCETVFELAERKIRVTIVSPGPTATPGFDKATSGAAKELFAYAFCIDGRKAGR